jgi:hypothetical protein
MTAFWDVARCSLVEADRRFWGAYSPRIVAMKMETVRTSETSVYFHETIQHDIPENYDLHARRHENLKSHKLQINIDLNKQIKIIKMLREMQGCGPYSTCFPFEFRLHYP